MFILNEFSDLLPLFWTNLSIISVFCIQENSREVSDIMRSSWDSTGAMYYRHVNVSLLDTRSYRSYKNQQEEERITNNR